MTKINEGFRIVVDICENIEENIGVFGGSSKPKCNYDISFICLKKTKITNYLKNVANSFGNSLLHISTI